jgi:hypothetical protein
MNELPPRLVEGVLLPVSQPIGIQIGKQERSGSIIRSEIPLEPHRELSNDFFDEKGPIEKVSSSPRRLLHTKVCSNSPYFLPAFQACLPVWAELRFSSLPMQVDQTSPEAS